MILVQKIVVYLSSACTLANDSAPKEPVPRRSGLRPPPPAFGTLYVVLAAPQLHELLSTVVTASTLQRPVVIVYFSSCVTHGNRT